MLQAFKLFLKHHQNKLFKTNYLELDIPHLDVKYPV